HKKVGPCDIVTGRKLNMLMSNFYRISRLLSLTLAVLAAGCLFVSTATPTHAVYRCILILDSGGPCPHPPDPRPRPCNIYAAAGTPCVAAHSTVRALFSAYSGKLYQVKRQSDSATIDIGTLTAGGYANAAAQDAFCSSTSCTITVIYDQSAEGN